MPIYVLQERARAELAKIRRSDPYNDLYLALNQRVIRWSIDSCEAHGETDEFHSVIERLEHQVVDLMLEIMHEAVRLRYPIETVKLGLTAMVAEELPLFARFSAEVWLFNTLTRPQTRIAGAHPSQRRSPA